MWPTTSKYKLSSSPIYPMIAHHCTRKTKLLHFAMHIKTLLMHTLIYPRTLFHYQEPQVSCAKIGNIGMHQEGFCVTIQCERGGLVVMHKKI